MSMDDKFLPTWNLGHFFSGHDDPALDKVVEGIEENAREFEQKWRGKVAGADAATLLEAVTDYEAVARYPLAAYGFAHLKFSEDSSEQANTALISKVRRKVTDAHRSTIFFTLELDEIPDERFAKFLEAAELAPYAHYLRELRRQKPHRLSEPEEALMTMKALTGKTAFVQLYSRLTSGFRFPSPLGEDKELTGSEVLALFKNPDHEVRRKAMEIYAEAYEREKLTISSVWNAIALDHSQSTGLRGYEHPIAPVHEGNELSAKAVDSLMQATRDNYPLAQRYYRWKAGELGMEKLTSCDLIAPLPGEEPEPIEFERARELVLESFGSFHPRFEEIAKAFFDEERIDAPPRPGKSGGAFCMGVSPDLPVYVLMNYTGKLRDVATLAHELGHGIHFTLAGKQPLLEYGPVLPVAETASVFGELLLSKKMLESGLDEATRKRMVAEKVEDIIATTFRQTMYTDFELDAHLKIAEEQLEHEQFCELWANRLTELYGDSVETLEASKLFWSAIPHFIHTRFYCYAYTFGELLVLALYRRYQEEGDAFAPKLIRVLETGGSLSPGEMLAELDYNLEDPAFWLGGYEVLSEMLDELGA